jgi:hypothetical protein
MADSRTGRYTKEWNEKTKQYIKTNTHRVLIPFVNEEYNEKIKPAADLSNMPVGKFIRTAINEKIERDFPDSSMAKFKLQRNNNRS